MKLNDIKKFIDFEITLLYGIGILTGFYIKTKVFPYDLIILIVGAIIFSFIYHLIKEESAEHD
jgi:riboflavin transporter FmnP